MTVEMKRLGEGFGVYFVDILSQCLHIRSMSGGALEDLQRGSLQVYLSCLARVIGQLLCFSTTSSTSFSWRLPRALYLLEEKTKTLSSSTGEEEKKVVWLPMKVLDDLSICEQRAVLRAETQLSAKPTVQQELGKEWWSKKRKKYSELVKSVLSNNSRVLDVWLEHPVGLAYEGQDMQINLSGLVDMFVFYPVKCGGGYIPLVLLFEFTLHKEIVHIVNRVVTYASSVYTRYGFLTAPVITVMRSPDEDFVEKIVLLVNTDRLGISKIYAKVKHLEELLARKARPRHASREVCLWCDTELRRRCEYHL